MPLGYSVSMSDQRSRELERAFRATGSVADEAAWLGARLRAGEVEQTKVELAVFLGSGAARLVIGDRAPIHTRPPRSGVKGFVRKGLAQWGHVVLVRAAIAAARLVVRDDEDLPEAVGRGNLHLAEEYAIEPRQALMRALVLPLPQPRDERWHSRWWACFGCTCTLSALDIGGPQPGWHAKDTAESVAKVVGGDAAVRAGIVAELLPWALGYSDPVRERVDARRRA